jgi:hypothetical protein
MIGLGLVLVRLLMLDTSGLGSVLALLPGWNMILVVSLSAFPPYGASNYICLSFAGV